MKQLHCRVPPTLKPYLPNLDIGLRAILTRWQFPEPTNCERVKTLVRIPDAWMHQIEEIAAQATLPKNDVVIAALEIAANTSFNPRPEMPRDTPLRRGRRPKGGLGATAGTLTGFR